MKIICPAQWRVDSLWRPLIRAWILGLAFLFATSLDCRSGDLKEVQEKGVLIHLGVPYANFVTGGGDGLDVELMKLFARHLGVEYRYVRSTWADVIPDLVGKRVSFEGGSLRQVADVTVMERLS